MAPGPFAVGDVFRLKPFDGSRCGYGQILDSHGTSGGHFYFGVFKRWYRGSDADIEEVANDAFALLALSMDALLFHGHWQVVGSTAVPPVALPSSDESVAPIRLQHAFEALVGSRPWLPAYDRLKV